MPRKVLNTSLWESMEDQDLSDSDFRGRRFAQSNFASSDLSRSVLTKAHLFRCNLSGAKLRDVNARRCSLNLCRLDHCDLTGADLSRAMITKCSLLGADLTGCRFDGLMTDIDSLWPSGSEVEVAIRSYLESTEKPLGSGHFTLIRCAECQRYTVAWGRECNGCGTQLDPKELMLQSGSWKIGLGSTISSVTASLVLTGIGWMSGMPWVWWATLAVSALILLIAALDVVNLIGFAQWMRTRRTSD